MKAQIIINISEPGYIANPYWPEVNWLVKLEQSAGCHPKHGADKRKMLIETYCGDNGISLDEVARARKKVAEEFWYRDSDGNIVIPRHHFVACLVQALRSHPLKREIDKDQLRSFVNVWDLKITPKKTKHDGIYARYIKNPDSNLRRYHEDQFIKDFTAEGEILFEDSVLEARSLESLISYAGRWIGVGACRKMGYGRFSVESFA